MFNKIFPYLRVLASTIAIVILLLACVLSFRNMLSEALRGEMESRLVDETNRSRDVIGNRIEGQWNALQTAAAFLQSDEMDLAGLQRLRLVRPDLREFQQLGAVTVDGKLLYGYRMPPDCMYLLQDTFRGKNQVSYVENLFPFELTTNEGLLFSVPVWHQGKVAGAVYGMLTGPAMAGIFASGDSAAPGWLFVSASSFHKIILSSDKAGMDREIVAMLRSDEGTNLRQDIEWQLYYNKTGTGRFDYGGESYYLSAVSLPQLNGWYLDSVVPASHVDQTLRRILMAAMAVNLVFALMIMLAFWSYSRSERKNAQKMERLAYWDGLTGLYNWAGMQRAVAQRSSAGKYILAVVNFHEFSLINSIMGHEYGNRLLQRTAVMVRAAAGPEGMACRVGADRFIICFQHTDDYARQLEKLLTNIRELSTGYALKLVCGVAVMQEGESLRQAFEHCLMALKTMRPGMGTQSVGVFDLRLDIESRKYQSLKADFVMALSQGSIELYVQPVTEQPSGRLLSLEALAHWEHSQVGLIRTDWFVPLLEEIGQLQRLDLYMLDKVCQWLTERQAQGKDMVPVSVNLSPAHFANDTSVARLVGTVRQYALPFSWLQLELPARVFQCGSEPLIRRLNQLHELGFRVVVDDFGAGYVPFQVLSQLHIDVFKLDRGTLKSLPQGHQILEEFCRFAQRLMIPVVVKGIETSEQAECLREMEPYDVQGYLYGRPVSAAAFAQQEEGEP